LELGADRSSKINALPELRDFNQLTSQRPAIATDNPSTSADLTPLQTRTAETKPERSAQEDALLPDPTALTAIHSQTQDAPPSSPSLEEPAETTFSQLANRDAQASEVPETSFDK